MFPRLLKQSFHRQRRRKVLAAAAVVAGMAVATAMLTLRVSLGDDLSRELRQVGANLVVTPAADSLPLTLNGVDLRAAHSGALLSEAGIGAIKATFWGNNIVAFSPVLQTTADSNGVTLTVEGAYFDHPVTVPGDGRIVQSGLRRLEPSWQVEGGWPDDGRDFVGAGPSPPEADVPLMLASGRGPLMPHPEAPPDKVLAGRRLGIPMGARLLLHSTEGGVDVPVQVSGVLTTGTAEDSELLTPLAVAQALAGEPGQYRQLLVSAITKPDDAFARRDPAAMNPADRDRWQCSPYAASIAANLTQALPGTVARVIRPIADSEGEVLSKLRLLIFFITGLALAASALAIGSAMTAAVLERRGEIALMKAVGAYDSAVGRLLLSEAALLGLGGGALGYLLGEWIAAGIARHLLVHGLAWKPALLPLVLLLGVLVALLGSLAPLRRALRLEPALVLRGER